MRECGPVIFTLGSPFWPLGHSFFLKQLRGPNQAVSEVSFCSVIPDANSRHLSIYYFVFSFEFSIIISESDIGTHYLLSALGWRPNGSGWQWGWLPGWTFCLPRTSGTWRTAEGPRGKGRNREGTSR